MQRFFVTVVKDADWNIWEAFEPVWWLVGEAARPRWPPVDDWTERPSKACTSTGSDHLPFVAPLLVLAAVDRWMQKGEQSMPSMRSLLLSKAARSVVSTTLRKLALRAAQHIMLAALLCA